MPYSDWFCGIICSFFEEDHPTTFAELLNNTGFARGTLAEHLRHLVEGGFVEKRRMPPRAKGRPMYTYRLMKPLADGPRSTRPKGAVIISFERLRGLCSFESRGYCAKLKEACNLKTCPETAR